jgi:hypothetical protein
MKAIFLITLSVNVLQVGSNSISTAERYETATQYCNSISTEFDAIAEQYGLATNEVIPIIFPECLRYDELCDQVETTTLSYFYTLYGSEGANFSVGRFQMKPKFIEDLEANLAQSTLSESQIEFFNYSVNDSKEIRAERIRRMRSQEWQIHYLCVFYKIMEQKTRSKNWDSPTEKISHFAAAYNYGFDASIEQINSWESKAKFPYGKDGQPAPYAEIASEFYLKLTSHEN